MQLLETDCGSWIDEMFFCKQQIVCEINVFLMKRSDTILSRLLSFVAFNFLLKTKLMDRD